MKRTALTFVLFLASILSLSAQKSDTLSVMSYNLRFGELSSMEDFSEAINAENPDFVLLQECDWGTFRERAPRQHGVKFVNVLAYHTGMFGLYGKSIDYRGGYYGIGLLSRYPIISSRRVILPNKDNKEQRILLMADVLLPSSRIVTVASTHLEVSSAELRETQARFITKTLKRNPYPVILAGDMNAQPDEPAMEYLRKNWKDCSDRELTFSTVKPSIKIDYIYARPAGSVEVLEKGVLTQYRLSDHFPIKSIISIH